MVLKAQRHLQQPHTRSHRKKSVLVIKHTHTHTHPPTHTVPDQLFLPIVKLKPSMLKVALRHFLNPCFLELSSDIFSSWLRPSARGEKLWKQTPQVGKRALSRDVKDQRGSLERKSQGWHLLQGPHPICKNPSWAHHTGLFLCCLPFLHCKENKHTDGRCFSLALSLPPAHTVTLPTAKLCLITGSLSLSLSFTVTLTRPFTWALSIYAFTDLRQWYTLMFILGRFRVPSSNLCGYCTCGCVCVYKWTCVMCHCKRATFLWCLNKTLCQNCWLDEIKGRL